MKPWEICWQASLVGRTVMMLSTAAGTSTAAKVLGSLGQGLLQVGRGSLTTALVRVDWGVSKWLACSWIVRRLVRLGASLEQVGWAGAQRGRTAWAASRVGQGLYTLRVNRRGAARFWAGILLGMAVGTIALGHVAGTLTHRRLLAAAVLIPISLLLCILPVNLPTWLDNSWVFQGVRYLINMGLGE